MTTENLGKEGQSVGQKSEDEDQPCGTLSKDELLQSMERVDREITQVEQQITNLKKKQVS